MSKVDDYIVGEKSKTCKGVLCVIGLICVIMIMTVANTSQDLVILSIPLVFVIIMAMLMRARELQLESKNQTEESVSF